MNYRIGSKVRIIKNIHGHVFRIGQIVTICGMWNHVDYGILYRTQDPLDICCGVWNVSSKEIEPLKMSFAEIAKY